MSPTHSSKNKSFKFVPYYLLVSYLLGPEAQAGEFFFYKLTITIYYTVYIPCVCVLFYILFLNMSMTCILLFPIIN